MRKAVTSFLQRVSSPQSMDKFIRHKDLRLFLLALHTAVSICLKQAGAQFEFGQFPGEPCVLEEFRLQKDVFRSFNARQIVYNAVASDSIFLESYERLVRECVVPHLVRMLAAATETCPPGDVLDSCAKSSNRDPSSLSRKRVFYYQYPPSLRLQPGPTKEFGRS